MKKILIAASALVLLSSVPAHAEIVIQPTIIESASPVYASPVFVPEPVAYPVHVDNHRHYDWKYWHDRKLAEERHEHDEHFDHDHR